MGKDKRIEPVVRFQKPKGDDEPFKSLEGPVTFPPEHPMGKMLELAMAMAGVLHDSDWDSVLISEVGDCLQQFYCANKDAPAEAGVHQIKNQMGLHFNPLADYALNVLALNLFAFAVRGLDFISTARAQEQIAKKINKNLGDAIPRREKDGPFDVEGDRFEPSDLARSLNARKQ